jgi:hypothetical protein
MRAAALPLLAAALALGLTACGADDGAASSEGPVTVELAEQNGSGQSGTATLTAAGEGTTDVVIELDGGTAGPQPAHIHVGTCANLDPQPKYPLEGVVDGRSETTVQAPLAELAEGELAINVHKSEAEVQIYVACGNLGSGTGGEQPASDEPDYGY